MTLTTSNWIQIIVYVVSLTVFFTKMNSNIEALKLKLELELGGIHRKIDKLETKQTEHNDFMKRLAVAENHLEYTRTNCVGNNSRLSSLEQQFASIRENVKSNQHRLDALEN